MAHKIFCYVDETGQDTEGRLFIVTVLIAAEARDELRQICESFEEQSHKGQRKWAKSSEGRRLSYIQHLLDGPIVPQLQLYYAVYTYTQAYVALTVQTISHAFEASQETQFEATVLIDGLPRTMERMVGLQLRRLGVQVKKVRGLDDEADALIRLADAMCGLVRAAWEGKAPFQVLLSQGIEMGAFHDISLS